MEPITATSQCRDLFTLQTIRSHDREIRHDKAAVEENPQRDRHCGVPPNLRDYTLYDMIKRDLLTYMQITRYSSETSTTPPTPISRPIRL